MTIAAEAPLSAMEALVAQAMASCGQCKDIAGIGRDTAMSQDAGIDGIDVWDFGTALGEVHWPVLETVPWERFSDQRASFYGCGSMLYLPVWLMFRIATWPFHREAPIPPLRPAAERLTVGHLAAVLERGAWFEPPGPPA
jgi:hypothetical protein